MSTPMFTVSGDKALAKELKELSAVSYRKIMKPAITAGLNPLLKRARSLASSNFASNTIAKGIKKRTYKSKKGKIVGKIFVSMPKESRTIKLEGRQVPFEVVANILEFGRKDGSLPARSFMRRSREEAGGQALQAVLSKAKQRLDIEWSKNKGLKLK